LKRGSCLLRCVFPAFFLLTALRFPAYRFAFFPAKTVCRWSRSLTASRCSFSRPSACSVVHAFSPPRRSCPNERISKRVFFLEMALSRKNRMWQCHSTHPYLGLLAPTPVRHFCLPHPLVGARQNQKLIKGRKKNKRIRSIRLVFFGVLARSFFFFSLSLSLSKARSLVI